MPYCVIITNVSNIEEAKKIAHGLVKDRLAACANIIHGVTSVYSWKNEICQDNEFMLVIKTRSELFGRVKDFIIKNHSYELPEVIMLPIEQGLEGYLNWIRENTDEKSNNNSN